MRFSFFGEGTGSDDDEYEDAPESPSQIASVTLPQAPQQQQQQLEQGPSSPMDIAAPSISIVIESSSTTSSSNPGTPMSSSGGLDEEHLHLTGLSNNPVDVIEYAQRVVENGRGLEMERQPRPEYMNRQTDINVNPIFIFLFSFY